MTDAERIAAARVLQPDLVDLIRAIVREEIAAWAVARRDAALQEVRYIEKHILPGLRAGTHSQESAAGQGLGVRSDHR